MAMNKLIAVEVAYACADQQRILAIEVEQGNTIEQTIHLSGIIMLFPEINLSQQKVGVWGQVRKLSDVVCDGDRIEIYRPLMIDPKEARRRKANPRSF